MLTPTDILSRYWPEAHLPIDPIKIAERAGVKVLPLPLDEWEVSGKYEEVGYRGMPTIYFNPEEGDYRRRFTIAHELGHYFLNHGPRYRDTRETFNDGYNYIEVSANKFAADILMPRIYLEILINKKGITSPVELSRIFAVSETAMNYRLQNLGFY
ncbi:ImmA/IrrE family metallo-endopeptidase [Acetobacter sp.]|uniref:ImmA/IrrE family metallo-endopeptidase n=1 Tax=Acetobacter sp. TaxID=440 RepID=UPI0039EC3AEF